MARLPHRCSVIYRIAPRYARGDGCGEPGLTSTAVPACRQAFQLLAVAGRICEGAGPSQFEPTRTFRALVSGFTNSTLAQESAHEFCRYSSRNFGRSAPHQDPRSSAENSNSYVSGGLSSRATPRPRTRLAMVSRRSCIAHGRSISTRTASSSTSIRPVICCQIAEAIKFSVSSSQW